MSRKGRIIKHIVIVAAICLVMGLTAYVLRRDDGYKKNQEFYSSDEEYDVWFLGSSHAVMGVLPMELWNDYGITSYNLANNGQMLPIDYWVLRDALNRKTPKLVVVDVYTLYADEKYAVMEYAHGSLDPMPMSWTKIQAICDIFPKEERLEFFLPFSIYHNRWDIMTSDFFDRTPSCQKGAYENNALGTPMVEPGQVVNMKVADYEETPETTNKQYLRKMVELCQEKGIPVLLTAAPFNDAEHLALWTNSARQIAAEYDVPFVNGVEADLIRRECDLFDAGHLNSSGARKWTAYLGEYISSNYEIEDKRSDLAYEHWNVDYEEYRTYKAQEINEDLDLYKFLMLLKDDEWSVCVSLEKGSAYYKDNWFWQLLYNAGEVTKTANSSQHYFGVIDNGNGKVTELYGQQQMQIDTSFGTLNYAVDDSGNVQLSTADGQLLVPDTGEVGAGGLQIWVFRHKTGELVRYATF